MSARASAGATPECPSPDALGAFVDHSCRNTISSKSYSPWVAARAEADEPWAVQMLAGVRAVEAYFEYWGAHIDMLARRKAGGMSVLCQTIDAAVPIARRHVVHSVQNCCVTGQRGRPCFEIQSTRSSQPSIYVHHTLLQSAQSLWAVKHHGAAMRHMVRGFCATVGEGSLAEICAAFDASPQRATILGWLAFVARDVRTVFLEDNCLALAH